MPERIIKLATACKVVITDPHSILVFANLTIMFTPDQWIEIGYKLLIGIPSVILIGLQIVKVWREIKKKKEQ